MKTEDYTEVVLTIPVRIPDRVVDKRIGWSYDLETLEDSVAAQAEQALWDLIKGMQAARS